MDETEPQDGVGAEAYPENWDDHAKAVANSERTLKLKDGQSATFHIISGPLVFNELYYVTGLDPKSGKETKKRIALPFSAQLPGYKLKAKYIAEVILTDGPAKGAHKLYEFGISVAKQLEKIKSSTWKSTRACDISVSRTGAGQNDTEYFVTAVPPSMPAEGNPVEFNLVAEARFSTAEELKALPTPTALPSAPAASGKVSTKQLQFIHELLKQKDMTKGDVEKMAKRKFGAEYKSMDDLTTGQASQLIDTLQAL